MVGTEHPSNQGPGRPRGSPASICWFSPGEGSEIVAPELCPDTTAPFTGFLPGLQAHAEPQGNIKRPRLPPGQRCDSFGGVLRVTQPVRGQAFGYRSRPLTAVLRCVQARGLATAGEHESHPRTRTAIRTVLEAPLTIAFEKAEGRLRPEEPSAKFATVSPHMFQTT